MPLGTTYTPDACGAAGALEILGGRWTLLIVTDLFYGLHRFGDLKRHLGIPPAVLSDRLRMLESEGLVEATAANKTRKDYRLTMRGASIWPIVASLVQWGNAENRSPSRRQELIHAQCDSPLTVGSFCVACGHIAPADEVWLRSVDGDGMASSAHRLLSPIRI